MARPKKERVVCSMPKHRSFCPADAQNAETVYLAVDEYEVLRLHDLEHLTQSEVARQMLLSRPSVALLLNSAHEKLVDAIVNGKKLTIEGGNCAVCEIGKACKRASGCDCSQKHRCGANCRYGTGEIKPIL